TSSECVEGVEHDVYPHMFCDWYDNFWDLYENELGRKREDYFDARPGVKMFKGGDEPYQELFNPTTMNAIVANLKSGVMSPAEMLLMGYSTLDLAGYPFNREGYDQLDKLSVNGQLYSSNTSTEPVAQLMNYMLQLIWSIKAEQTLAATYQDFLRHTLSFPNGAPFAHMLKDSLQDGLVAPLEALLRTLKADIRLSTTVSAVRLTDGGARISWGKTGVNQAGSHEIFDSVIMAVPNVALRDLVLGANVGGSGGSSDLPGDRIIDREPSLAETRRLRAVPIPVLDLYLKRKLPGFPVENIGLAGAKYGLSVVDIAQLWPTRKFGGNTALVLAASDGEALPSLDDEGMARAMMLELRRYYPQINIGIKWGDPDCDVDWTKTHFRSNAENALFLNDVGSWDWRPAPSYPTLPGLFFAGDLARSNVDMATVEGAVESGVRAASLVQAFDAERHGGAMRGKPITIVKHTTYGDTALRAAKLALMPFAYAAKALTRLKQDDSEAQLGGLGNALQSDDIALLPMQFALDWWTTAYWFWNAALSPDEGDQPLGPSDHDDDNFIGLGAAALMVLGEMASYASEQCRGGGSVSDKAGALAGGLSAVLGIEIPKTNAAPKRRWRPKR
ncbi:MAG: FAD-dependent oxidoreductase, partial [Pontixanthobacter sp.]